MLQYLAPEVLRLVGYRQQVTINIDKHLDLSGRANPILAYPLIANVAQERRFANMRWANNCTAFGVKDACEDRTYYILTSDELSGRNWFAVSEWIKNEAHGNCSGKAIPHCRTRSDSNLGFVRGIALQSYSSHQRAIMQRISRSCCSVRRRYDHSQSTNPRPGAGAGPPPVAA